MFDNRNVVKCFIYRHSEPEERRISTWMRSFAEPALERSEGLRMTIVVALFLFCFILSPQARAETIRYSIRQMGFDGQATLTMVGPKDYKDRKTLLIVFKANGTNFSDEEDIYVDPSTYKPLFVERNFNLSIFGHGNLQDG